MRMVLAAMLALVPFAASAQDDPNEVALEARKGYFQMLGTNMGILAGLAKGDIAYDEALAVRAATNVSALSQYDVPMHFIEGTSNADLGDETEALPVIWTDRAGFEEKFAGLQKAAEGIPQAVVGGQGNVVPVVQALGASCKACHDTYRAK